MFCSRPSASDKDDTIDCDKDEIILTVMSDTLNFVIDERLSASDGIRFLPGLLQ